MKEKDSNSISLVTSQLIKKMFTKLTCRSRM